MTTRPEPPEQAGRLGDVPPSASARGEADASRTSSQRGRASLWGVLLFLVAAGLVVWKVLLPMVGGAPC